MVSTHWRMGIPAREIVRFADEQRVDLIVMGTRGRTGVEHVFLGSVAENVLKIASCPVLVVRAGSETEERKAENDALWRQQPATTGMGSTNTAQ